MDFACFALLPESRIVSAGVEVALVAIFLVGGVFLVGVDLAESPFRVLMFVTRNPRRSFVKQTTASQRVSESATLKYIYIFLNSNVLTTVLRAITKEKIMQ